MLVEACADAFDVVDLFVRGGIALDHGGDRNDLKSCSGTVILRALFEGSGGQGKAIDEVLS